MKKVITVILIATAFMIFANASYVFNNGYFTVTGNSGLDVSIVKNFGGNKGFGYYLYDPSTGKVSSMTEINFDSNGNFTIDASEGQNIGFYTKKGNGDIIYSHEPDKKGNPTMSSIGMADDGESEIFNIKFNGNNNGVQIGISNGKTPAPAGQPLPNILSTSLLCAIIALGSLFLLKKKHQKTNCHA